MPRKQLIALRRGTTAQWAAADAASTSDPTRLLAAGEPGLDTTTGVLKVGDGVKKFADLPGYLNQEGLSSTIGRAVPSYSARAVLGDASGDSYPDLLEEFFGNEPNGTLVFPDGDYPIGRTLHIGHNNSVILQGNARLFASARIPGPLVNYETTDPVTPGQHRTLPQGKRITGGYLDAAGLADTALRCAVFEGLHVEGIHFTNFRERGLVVDRNKSGTNAPNMTAEGMFRNLHFLNETNEWLSSVGVEAIAADNHFENIVVINAGTGLWDRGGNIWDKPHVWLSIADYWPGSIAFRSSSTMRMHAPYADTYRVGWQIDTGASVDMWGRCIYLINAGEFIPAALNASHPGSIFKTPAGQYGLRVDGLDARNYPGASGSSRTKFIDGPVSEDVNIEGWTGSGSWGSIANADLVNGAPGDYHRGRLLGRRANFQPAIVGATTAGAASYSQRDGYMTVYRDKVTITVQVQGAFDNTIAGNLRIPLPINPTLPSVGRVGFVTGLPSDLTLQVQPGESAATLVIRSGNGSATLDGAGFRGQSFYFNADIDLPIPFFIP